VGQMPSAATRQTHMWHIQPKDFETPFSEIEFVNYTVALPHLLPSPHSATTDDTRINKASQVRSSQVKKRCVRRKVEGPEGATVLPPLV